MRDLDSAWGKEVEATSKKSSVLFGILGNCQAALIMNTEDAGFKKKYLNHMYKVIDFNDGY